MNDGIESTFLYVVIMLVVLAGAYFTTKLLSGKTSRLMKGKYINVLDRMIIAKDKQILLIEVGDKHLLIGVTNQSVNIIETVDKEGLDTGKDEAQDVSHKGFGGKIMALILKAKESETNLKKARMQGKKNKKPFSQQVDDDILEKMSCAIEQRKNRIDNNSVKNGDNE